MRRIFQAVVLLCVLYFVVGWIGTRYGWVTSDQYFAYAGLVGSLASVVGLISLTRPALSSRDLEGIEADNWKAVAESAKRLEELNAARTKNKQDLDSLEQKRQEMELLVRKQSLVIFLTEQAAHHERVVLDELERNTRQKHSLAEHTDAAAKLKALHEDISQSPHLSELNSLLESSRRRTDTLALAFESAPWYFRALVQFFEAFGKVIIR